MEKQNKSKAELLQEIEVLKQQLFDQETAKSQTTAHRYQLLAEAAFEGIVFSQDGVFIDVNDQFIELIGYQRDELIGKPIIQFVAPQSRQQVAKAIQTNFLEPYEFFCLHKDGHEIETEARARIAQINGRIMRVTAIRDITEWKRNEEALRISENKFAQAFYTSPDSININRLVDGLYLEINQGFTNLTGFTEKDVIGKTSLELDIWADPADRDRLVKGLREHGEVKNLEAAFQTKDGNVRIGLMSARVMEINSEMCILSVTRDISERNEAQEQINLLNTELLAAYDQTLAGWSRALNLRDPNTDAHSQRVVETTLTLAKQANIPDEELIHIQRGAILHDIGKMGIPDQILLKPGPLTTEEWKIMHKHPIFAYQMLSQIPFLLPALDIPRYHHERWDGTGYPHGLAGEDIPLAARIFAVVDTFDALTSDRSYRPAWKREDALAYIKENAGTHFDPKIVKLFFDLDQFPD